MRRAMIALLLVGACARVSTVTDETPSTRVADAADSARATRVASIIGRPAARFNGMYWEGSPPAAPQRGSGGVLMAFIARDGVVDSQTLTVLESRGPIEYTRNVCRALPGLRLRTIQGQPIESLVIMPLTHDSDRLHAELVQASGRILATLNAMSLDERRAWLVNSGCSRYQ